MTATPNPAPDPLVGALLGGSYRLVRRIGAGGMGAVYEARHITELTRSAIKVLNKELAQDATLLSRFRREAEITASLDNPHVVKLYAFEQPPDAAPYMVMEYLEGEDLESRLKRIKRLQGPMAREVLRALSIALSEAHGAGVVHRDLKPGNIFFANVNGVEQVKLLDFGLSKGMKVSGEGLTFFGQLLGTVWYMSPEQSRGQEATAASDVYALGVVLYQALTGELPYQAESPHEYLYRIQTAEPRPLSQVAPDLLPGIEPVLRRAMAKEPAERFGSVREFSEALDALFARGSGARAATDPKLRAVPGPGRTSTDPKLRASTRGATDPKLRVAPPAGRTTTDPRIKAPRPFDEDGEGATRVARLAAAPTAATVMGIPAFTDDSTVVRPLPGSGPPPPGDDQTFVSGGETSDATVVRSLPTQREESTRVTAAPAPLPPEGLMRTAMSVPVVPARPVTSPFDEVPEPDSPGIARALQRPTTDPDESPPEPEPVAPPRRTAPPMPGQRETPLDPEAIAPAAQATSHGHALFLGLGVGVGVGLVVLLAAVAWRFLH